MATTSSDLLIPFGLREGRMWRPHEVERGLGCGCTCPGCGCALVARNKGEVRRPYFAHHAASSCTTGFESAVHLMAKQILVHATHVQLPEWSGTKEMPNPPTMVDVDGRTRRGRRVTQAGRLAPLLAASPERTLGGVRPDVLAQDDLGTLLIEVRVTHRVDQPKREAVQAKGYRMFEIDLSAVSAQEAGDPERFTELVLLEPSNRLWLSLPDIEGEWREAMAELKAQVEASAASFQHESVAEAPKASTAWPRSLRPGSPHAPQEILRTCGIGSRIWHKGLGVGTVVSQLVSGSPVFQVDFDSDGARSIVLEESGAGRAWQVLVNKGL